MKFSRCEHVNSAGRRALTK